VFGLGDGWAVHAHERECSIQRRYQKIIEESPAPGLADATRAAMCQAALSLCRQERYRGAGTIEFVLDADSGAFYFLEMNTRIQVEHPVTEMNTGLDLVALQIRLARGDDLGFLDQAAIRSVGHAIECRIYAENPDRNFLPSPGPLKRFRLPPADAGLRIDTGVREGDQITFHYDPMIAKVIAHGSDRDAALDRMAQALRGLEIEGVASNVGFLLRAIGHPAFRTGDVFTGFIGKHAADLTMAGETTGR
jgi:3-methylcrotonyl-CoA carboxylase alpha subunit